MSACVAGSDIEVDNDEPEQAPTDPPDPGHPTPAPADGDPQQTPTDPPDPAPANDDRRGAAARPRMNPTTWIAVGSALNGVGAFAFQVVGTRSLGATGYAPIGVLWTLQYLWVAVAVTALEAYVTRLVTTGGPASTDLARFLRLFGRWLVAAAILAGLIGVLLAGPLFEGLTQLGMVLGLVVLGFGWYGVVRGRAAGMGRFRAYGLATIAESTVRLVAAVAVLLVVTSTTSLAWAMPIGPLAVGLWAWLRGHQVGRRPVTDPAAPAGGEQAVGTGRRFLAAASTANAAVQFLLAGGPLVLLPLGADPASVAVFFTTITAARVPMTFALNGGLSRVLPPLTRLAQAGDGAGLRRAALRVVVGIALLAAAAAVGAAAVGPLAMELVFGAEFRPDRTFVVVVAISTVLAVGGLLLDQVYIAMAREATLPRIWLSAVALAGVLVLALPGSPTMRVAVAFGTATAVAVAALSLPLLRGSLALRYPGDGDLEG